MDAKVPSMLVELKIKHKNVLVVGGKADALSAVLALKDSSVTLVAQRHEMHREVLDLAEKGGFAWLARNCEERDFIGKQIVIVDSSLPQQSIIHIKHICKTHSILFATGLDAADPDFQLVNIKHIESQKENAVQTFHHLPQFMSNETIAYHIEPDYGIEMNPRAIKNISSQKLIHNTDALTIHGNFAGEKSYSNASHLLSLVSYSLSDISFVYPAFTNNFIGHESLLKCQPDSRLNVKGHTTKVVKMLTNTNAGAIAEGASSTGLESSVLMSSTSLPHFLATIHRLTKLRKPMVFHIGLQTATSTLQLINDSADIYKTAQVSPESIIITSGTLQETHDVAILAYMLNFTDVEEKQSVLHFFDGVLEEDSVVRQCSLADLKAISNQVSQFSSSSTVSLSSNISGKTVTNFHRLEHAFETFSKCVGRSYAPFMFSGSTNAKVMIVSLASSPAACAISQVVSEYNRKNPKDCASYLKVVVYRPWNTEAFLKIVPESVRDIIVIDSVTLSFHSLREDIQASFYTQGAKSRVNVHDSVFSNYEPSDHSGSISVSALSKFFGTFMQPAVGVMWPGARTTSKSLNFFLENHKAEFGPVDDLSYTYWVVESYPREVVSSSQLVFEQLCSYDEYCKVQRLVIHASKSLEPCTLSQFRLSEHDMNLSSLSEQVNLVFVTHIPLLKTYDIVGNLRHGGTLVINTSLGADELSAFLPSCVKMHLEALSISVYVVDAHQIASDFTIFYGCKDKFERMVLESVLYHFIFADEPAKAKRMLFEQRERIIKSSANYNESYTANESVRTGLGSIRKIQIVHESLSGQENKSVLYKPKAYVAGTHPLPETEPVSLCSVSNDTVRLQMAFPAAYKLKPVSLPIGTFRVKVSANMRLTPDSYDRNVFHIELDTTGTGLKYEIGEALSVHCPNDINNVSSFITKHNFDSKQILAILSEATEECPSYCEMNTLEQLLINTIDIFGKPGRKFYNYLMQKMNSDDEKETLAKLMQNDSTFESFIETDTPTFADLIERFPSAILTAQDIVREVPVIKPRLYSISSSQRVHENSIHLLVVLVDWKGSAGVMRYGHATRFLMNAKLGEYLTVSIKPSVMKLPHSHESPVIMSGLGTGMAPFRAFIEERWYWKQQGKKVGPMILYFGSRYREMEYLYGEELDAYLNENILTSLRLAFSRDQKEKVYIQHKIEQDSDILHDLICNKNASFYLCGPTWPVPDISTALLSSFSKTMTPEKAEAYLEKMKDDERYILEVY